MTQRVVPIPSSIDVEPPAVCTATDDFPQLCQICLDDVGSVSGVCGPQCLARVCPTCLVRHLTASIYSFYPGVLPKVRCPVCLTLLNRNQWAKFLQSEATKEVEQEVEQVEPSHADDNAHVLEKYVVLCRQSCGFQSPCCHKTDYSMLPNPDDEAKEEAEVELPTAQVDVLPMLYQRAVDFCYHRVDGETFYHFISDTFQEHTDKVVWKLLYKIMDEERRAALLLRHLNKNPDTYTRCCGDVVCFKCKATNHHNGDCGDFKELDNVVECRGCGVTVVMVDGCDSLHCLCGYTFTWSAEVERQKDQSKRVAPLENAEYDKWKSWHDVLRLSLYKVRHLDATIRELRLARFVHDHRDLLRRLLLPRVFRKRLVKQFKGAETDEKKVTEEDPLDTVQHERLTRSQSVP